MISILLFTIVILAGRAGHQLHEEFKVARGDNIFTQSPWNSDIEMQFDTVACCMMVNHLDPSHLPFSNSQFFLSVLCTMVNLMLDQRNESTCSLSKAPRSFKETIHAQSLASPSEVPLLVSIGIYSSLVITSLLLSMLSLQL
ncbi:hypothetical protein B0T10DRAFT_487414 [Thelonectria olida]|uniref:Uncharacterized protein n=1 Tax=Thelonectria olida TaxID=1576542 RepID=A0A9P8W340_9HYPO|nr:hypothetical protein B0T10DRAFT_487414 [Thelonectria olida]